MGIPIYDNRRIDIPSVALSVIKVSGLNPLLLPGTDYQ